MTIKKYLQAIYALATKTQARNYFLELSYDVESSQDIFDECSLSWIIYDFGACDCCAEDIDKTPFLLNSIFFDEGLERCVEVFYLCLVGFGQGVCGWWGIGGFEGGRDFGQLFILVFGQDDIGVHNPGPRSLI